MRMRWAVSWGVVIVVGAGCSEAPEPPPESIQPPSQSIEPVEVLRVRGDTVEVKIGDYFFDFAVPVEAGRIVFEVENVATQYHNMDILKDGVKIAGLPIEDLVPEGVRLLEVTLEPGEYELWCTIAGHDERGMKRTLTVVAEARGPGNPQRGRS